MAARAPGAATLVMASGALSEAEVAHFLRVLGVAHPAPSLAALRRLVRAHLTRVPFENISKLWRLRALGLRDVPELGHHLEGIERNHCGGTCYANNFHLYRLLSALGYEAKLCGAAMASGEDVHAAIVVALDGREWLVDGGFAAPFLAPLSLDASVPQEVRLGSDRWVLLPRDTCGCSQLELWRSGEHISGYLLKPAPRTPEHFASVVRDSFRAEATFMNAVHAVRFFPERSVTVSNLSVIRSAPKRFRVERLPDRAAMVAAIEREIGIPAGLVHEAIEGLDPSGSIYG
jgi:N-hydroxyarylamine O-acetyltransferase